MGQLSMYAEEELKLKNIFAEYWEVLSEYSRKCLTTAMVMYRQCEMLADREELVYSGIFILITKVMEIEYSRIMYDGLIDYLNDNYFTVSEYPSFLKYYAKNGNVYVQKPKYITLGSYPYILGIKVGERDTDEFNYDNIIVKDYIEKAQCSEKNSPEIIQLCMGKMADLMSVKRNPSAHKGSISFNILKYVIEVFITKKSFLKSIMEYFYENTQVCVGE